MAASTVDDLSKLNIVTRTEHPLVFEFRELTRQKLESTTDLTHVDPGHDISHFDRVAKLCLWLAEGTAADSEILIASAYLHDWVQVPKNHPDRERASELSAQAVKGLLQARGWTDGKIKGVTTTVNEHSFSRGLKPSSLESQILQDADRLDALGVIGLMRLVSCGTVMGSAFYQSEDPFAEKRKPNDRLYMIDHIFFKLSQLPGLMNTKKARREAAARWEILIKLVDTLRDELKPGG